MWTLFKIINFFYILVSSYAWFSFMLPNSYIPLIISGFTILLFAIGNFKYRLQFRTILIVVVLMLMGIATATVSTILSGFYTVFLYFPAVLLFTLRKDYQQDLLNSITKWLCILLGVSMAVYLISLVIPLPHTTFIVPNNDFYMPFDNYFLYIYSHGYENEEAGVLRFGSIFLEPGHLSMICILMLFANRFQFKKQPLLWIPLSCIMISFSLTGYVLLLVSFFLIKIKNIYYMLITVIAISGGWLFVTEIWNDGDNPVNILIVQRLELDNNKGIKGNNRTVKQTDYFYKQCVKDGRIIMGIGLENKGDRVKGSGYKIYLLRYGIISTVLVGLIYLLLINPKANKRYALSFFFVIVLLFLQRAYPGWYSWLFFYTVGIGVMRNQKLFENSPDNHQKVKKLTMKIPKISS